MKPVTAPARSIPAELNPKPEIARQPGVVKKLGTMKGILLLFAIIGWFAVHPSSVLADEKPSSMTGRFDQILIPSVEKAILRPATGQGGEIAWGESYQLSALVEMFDATRDEKYAPLIVKLSDWIAKSRDDRQGLRGHPIHTSERGNLEPSRQAAVADGGWRPCPSRRSRALHFPRPGGMESAGQNAIPMVGYM